MNVAKNKTHGLTSSIRIPSHLGTRVWYPSTLGSRVFTIPSELEFYIFLQFLPHLCSPSSFRSSFLSSRTCPSGPSPLWPLAPHPLSPFPLPAQGTESSFLKPCGAGGRCIPWWMSVPVAWLLTPSGGAVGLNSCCCTTYALEEGVGIVETAFTSCGSGGWEVQGQDSGRFCIWWGPSSWYMDGQLLSMSPCGRRGEGAPWGLFYSFI